MPNRYLREGILDSDRVNSLSSDAEIFYRRLMSVVDDFGRFDGRPAILKARLYALKPNVRETDIPLWIAACVKAGLIALYQTDGKPYIQFHRLGEARASKSKYPPPPDGIDLGKLSDDGPCDHLRADANICSQTKTFAPSSSSSSVPITSSVKDTPQPPATAGGEVSDNLPKKSRPAKSPPTGPPEAVPIPPAIDTPEFRTTWADWIAERRERKKPLTERAAKSQLQVLAGLGPAKAVETVTASIRNGWAGLFPESAEVKSKPPPTRFPTKAELQIEQFAKDQAVVNQTKAVLAERNGNPDDHNATLDAFLGQSLALGSGSLS